MYYQLTTVSKRNIGEILSLPMNLDKTHFTLIKEVDKNEVREDQYKFLRSDINLNNELIIVSTNASDLKGIYMNDELIEERHGISENIFVELINTYRSFAAIELFKIPSIYFEKQLKEQYPKSFEDIKNEVYKIERL